MSAELIARLEAAEEGSRELDAAIWCALNGHTFVAWDSIGCAYRERPDRGLGYQQSAAIAPVTTSIDAALALAKKELPGWQFVMATGQEDMGPPWVQAYPHPVDEDVCRDAEVAETLPLALCIAVLRAKQ